MSAALFAYEISLRMYTVQGGHSDVRGHLSSLVGEGDVCNERPNLTILTSQFISGF